MVFPSLPIYLDPHNWSQQQEGMGIGIQNPPSMQLSTASTVVTTTVEASGSLQRSIRPRPMVDRAKMSKINQNDVVGAQKCPRCESTNTKFCYYNNYNLSQPRHFCKSCRRYWTRGGALRNVPVGGGCRRNNKKSKGSLISKSPSKPNYNDHRQVNTGVGVGGSGSDNANSSKICHNNNSNVNVGMAHFPTLFPFWDSMQPYKNNDYVFEGIGSLLTKNISNSTNTSDEFQGRASSIGNNNVGSLFLSNGNSEQWKYQNSLQVHHHQQHQQQQQQQQQNHQHFPFLTNLEPQIGLFQFSEENNNGESQRNFLRSKVTDSLSVSIGMTPQVNTIKMEENNRQGLSLVKNLSSGSGNSNDLFWNNGNRNGNANANAWNDVHSFTPPS